MQITRTDKTRILAIIDNSFHFLPRDARSAKRGRPIAVVSLSICPSVCPSVTLLYRRRIDWVSLKLITGIISLGTSLFEATALAI